MVSIWTIQVGTLFVFTELPPINSRPDRLA